MANKRLSQEEFVEKVKSIYFDEYEVIGQYITGRDKISIKHNCGCIFNPVAKSFLNKKVFCPNCTKGSSKKDNKIIIDKINKRFNNEFELIDYYINSTTPFKILHKKCGHINSVLFGNIIRSKTGCVFCGCNRTIKNKEIFEEEIFNISNGNIKLIDDYINSKTKVKFLYLPQNKEFYSSPNNILNKKGYPFNINYDKNEKHYLWNKHPEIAQYLNNPDDGYKYLYSSKISLDFKCPICGYINQSYPSLIINKFGKFVCKRCGDGFSYPEKFLLSFFEQNKVNYQYQISSKTYSWCGKYRYDFYLPDYNWLIEVQGMQHYRYEDVIQNDILKKENAIPYVTKYIELDARYSNLDYIKQSILNSDLNIFDQSSDWEACGKYASKSLLQTICNEWNNCYDVIQYIADNHKIHIYTVLKYLKNGNEYGLINFNYNEYLDYVKRKQYDKSSSSLCKNIICIETGEEFSSIKDAQNKFGKQKSKQISKVINGHAETAYGYHWKLKEA